LIRPVGVGDVIAVRTSGLGGAAIRLGSVLGGEPSPASHVAIICRRDARGRWWAIEGRPGGVGWVDAGKYLHGKLARYGNSNAAQPRTGSQRTAIARTAAGLLGTGYDWVGGIAGDGLDDMHLTRLAALLDEWWGWTDPANPGAAPGHIVCSSAASWAYRTLGLPGPEGVTERIQPADWWRYNKSLKPAAAHAAP